MNKEERAENNLLVLRAQQGEARAMGELISRWKNRLWRHALRLTDRDEDAGWDVLQDSLMDISATIHRLSDAHAFPAWAYRIVTNKARLWQRREYRRHNLHKSYAAEQIHMSELQVSLTTREEADPISRIQAAIAQLTPKDQAILGMHYEENFSIRQIAAILDIPPGTVKSRLFHARERLKETLKENGS